ncbi:ChaN family lipoprotein [Synechococcus sp. CS-1332]|uniref:ChaN family lipoprotein n=1 Tax=Synechococcus sp. CS-1332 TaxID=2847972 RepID=UPI00223BFF92|nr:ChaN family lipoprotein [Synechococcus sp. CS-1332]
MTLAALLGSPGPAAAATCVPAGAWVEPTAAGPRTVAADDLLDRLARRPVLLLGERHDSAAHHQWQLATLAALLARSPTLSLGLEMVPRRLQPVLDRWVAGGLGERSFLAALDWPAIWGYDAELYLPILRFAHDRRVPLLALNVERRLVRRVRAEGFAAVPAAEREGVGRPAPPSQAYRLQLHRLWQHHPFVPSSGQRRPGLEDPSFRRFVESQQLWDRAMAEAITDQRRRRPGTPVVALIGNGHLAGGHGVPHQLRALGLGEAAWLLPWEDTLDCAELQPGLATAVFGVASLPPAGLKLGVYLETHGGRVEIHQVAPGSLAERSGLRVGDGITAIDGQPVSSARQVIQRVAAHPAGRPLGLTVQRGSRILTLQLQLQLALP